ncbi:hypothetical protein T484DRAFT_1890107 [Baffinella frigidus]|nr:hypothetical protein T484DRAFT_1890107 [Cryptophyta sp. CCMP2293]
MARGQAFGGKKKKTQMQKQHSQRSQLLIAVGVLAAVLVAHGADGAAAARVTAFAAPSPCFAKPGLRTRVQGLCLKAKAKFELRDSPISDAAARLERVKQYAAVFRDEGMDGEVRKFNVRKVARGEDPVLIQSALEKASKYAKLFSQQHLGGDAGELKRTVRDVGEQELLSPRRKLRDDQ